MVEPGFLQYIGSQFGLGCCFNITFCFSFGAGFCIGLCLRFTRSRILFFLRGNFERGLGCVRWRRRLIFKKRLPRLVGRDGITLRLTANIVQGRTGIVQGLGSRFLFERFGLQVCVGVKYLVALAAAHPTFGHAQLVGHDPVHRGAGGATGNEAHQRGIVVTMPRRYR